MDNRQKFIMNSVHQHYNEAVSLGYEVVGVWLQGSQNYGLDCYDSSYQSDVDTKCIILPSLSDIVQGKAPVSVTHVRENNEHIDIKDIRSMIQMFKKQNNAYIEILFTDFYEINPKYKELVSLLMSRAEEIAHLNTNQALRCWAGTSLEKVRHLQHPFPNSMEKLNKFGYDPKQLHHILRVNDFIKKYVLGLAYKECLKPDDPVFLLDVKKGYVYDEDEAVKLAKLTDKNTNDVKTQFTVEPEPVNIEISNFLDEIKEKFITKYLKEQLLRS